jgi:hypothetical protein
MRIICALKDAEVRGEIPKDTSLKVAERLWLALWREDKNTSEEAVMQAELDPILPGGWDKWKHVSTLHPHPNRNPSGFSVGWIC